VTVERWHTYRSAGCAATIVVVILCVYSDAIARNGLGGRLFLTYQDTKNAGLRQEYFSQHYEVTYRERLFERNDFFLSAFFDDNANMTTDQTFRRYSGQLGLRNRVYTFNWRYTPKQKVTPIQMDPARERVVNEIALDVHVPKYPFLRLVYTQRQQFDQDYRSGNTRDWRGDLSYNYKILALRFNRWHSLSENTISRETDVFGGGIRLVKGFRRVLNINVGYDYQENQSTRGSVSTTTVTNNTFNTVVNGRFRNYVTGTFAGTFRRLETENNVSVVASDFVTTENDNVIFILQFFPLSPVRFDASRTLIASRVNSTTVQSDYYSLQAVMEDEILPGTQGRLQMARRFDRNTHGGGVVPPHLYTASIRSHLYEGIDLRADVNVTQRDDVTTTLTRYQTTTLFDLFLKPRHNLLITPHVQYIKFTNNVSFVRNDRGQFNVTSTYFMTPTTNLGFDWRHTRVTRGQLTQSTAYVLSGNGRFRGRSNMNISYGFNEVDVTNPDIGGPTTLDSRSRTLNLQMQVWISHKGSLSLTYVNIDRHFAEDTKSLALNYRLDF